jgi:hypothetical protein
MIPPRLHTGTTNNDFHFLYDLRILHKITLVICYHLLSPNAYLLIKTFEWKVINREYKQKNPHVIMTY